MLTYDHDGNYNIIIRIMTMVTTFKVVVSIIASIIISVLLLLVQLPMYHHYQQLLVQASGHRQCLLLLTPVVTMLLAVVTMQHLGWDGRSALAYLSSVYYVSCACSSQQLLLLRILVTWMQLLSSVVSTLTVLF
jgi:hypothetical protein